MQINVSQLLQEPIGATRDYNINEQAAIGTDPSDCLVLGKCHLLRTQRSILVNCTLRTESELTCSRCLSLFRHSYDIKFEEEYVPTVDVATGVPLPLPEDAGIFTIDKHHILDLG